MATHHGKEGVVTAGGTAVGELTSFTIETTGDVVEDTQLSDSTKSFLAGRTSFSGSLEMNYDEADAQQETLTAGSEISFVLLPEGNTSGDQSFTGTGIVTGMSINNAMDAVVSRSVTFQGTGALTKSTV
nr:phage major tail protein 2 [uncultured Mediterranean phage uvMED]